MLFAYSVDPTLTDAYATAFIVVVGLAGLLVSWLLRK
jgi:hypothetical protein